VYTLRVERPSDRLIELVALRQAQRRRFNERLAALDQWAEGPLPLRCECALVGCAATLKLTPWEYASVRAHAARFVVLVDHVEPETDEVVGTQRGWAVIEKPEGIGRDVALRTTSPGMQMRASW
jgi:hypothetical protein